MNNSENSDESSDNNTNHYDTLGVTEEATEDEIKKAYRKLCVKWHPDKCKTEKDKGLYESTFKDISEAYTVLSDPEKRQMYDDYGSEGVEHFEQHGGMSGGMGGMPGGLPPEVAAMFSQMGGIPGMGSMGGMGGLFGGQQKNDIPDCRETIDVTLEEIFSGVTKKQKFDRFTVCSKCDGKGSSNGKDITCKKCKGSGHVMTMIGPNTMSQQTCKNCDEGIDKKMKNKLCTKCDGVKYVKETVSIDVKIPKGSHNGFSVVIENRGNIIPEEDQINDNTRSRVIFKVNTLEHVYFKRDLVLPGENSVDDSNLLIEINVSFTESLMGFVREITHLDGEKLLIKNNKPVRQGDIMVNKGGGMYDTHGSRGELFIRIEVEHPMSQSEDDRIELGKLLTKESEHDIDFGSKTGKTISHVMFDDYIKTPHYKKSKNKQRKHEHESESHDSGQVGCQQS